VPRRAMRPERKTKRTILIVGEGPTEKAFLQHLHELYVSRDSDFAVKIESGFGGAPSAVIQKAVKLRSARAYDQCFVLIDSDRPLEMNHTLQERMNKRPRIEVLKSTPCIEGLFLTILGHSNFTRNSASTDQCKRNFEAYMTDDRKTDKRSYATRFTKQVLDAQRHAIPELDRILKAMQI
jgi:hypothetical protein